MSASQDKQQPSKRARSPRGGAFSEEERAAMKEAVREYKAESRRGSRGKQAQADAAAEVVEKIAAMEPADRAIAERIHALVVATAPELSPRLWYGMPAYSQDGKVLCFFQDARKFKTRYATLGFSDKANLDDGAMWPTTYAITQLTDSVEAKITSLIRQAIS